MAGQAVTGSPRRSSPRFGFFVSLCGFLRRYLLGDFRLPRMRGLSASGPIFSASARKPTPPR